MCVHSGMLQPLATSLRAADLFNLDPRSTLQCRLPFDLFHLKKKNEIKRRKKALLMKIVVKGERGESRPPSFVKYLAAFFYFLSFLIEL